MKITGQSNQTYLLSRQDNNYNATPAKKPEEQSGSDSQPVTTTVLNISDLVAKAAEEKKIDHLRSIEQKVLSHEGMHSAGGGLSTGSISYSYKGGPDGKLYISGGGVSVDISVTGDPDETIEKMQKVKSAALSPGNPSFKDFVIASRAAIYQQQAKMELTMQEFMEGNSETFPGISIYA